MGEYVPPRLVFRQGEDAGCPLQAWCSPPCCPSLRSPQQNRAGKLSATASRTPMPATPPWQGTPCSPSSNGGYNATPPLLLLLSGQGALCYGGAAGVGLLVAAAALSLPSLLRQVLPVVPRRSPAEESRAGSPKPAVGSPRLPPPKQLWSGCAACRGEGWRVGARLHALLQLQQPPVGSTQDSAVLGREGNRGLRAQALGHLGRVWGLQVWGEGYWQGHGAVGLE